QLIIFLITASNNITFFEKLAPNHYQYKKNTIRKCKRNGINLVLDISDYLQHYIYFKFKDLSLNKLINIIKPGDIVIDVGGNIGFVAMSIYKKMNGRVIIHSFEPDNTNYTKFEQLLKINPDIKINLNKVALGEDKYFAPLVMPTPDNRGGIRINKNINHIKEKISVVTLDEYVKQNNIQLINVIKVDVEGFEYNVLKGASYTIKKFHPILFIEWDNSNLKQQGVSIFILYDFLKKFNYKIIDIIKSEEITNENINEYTNIHTDVICI
ncbi:MAG: FkbM family methyltransferase, partial [Thermoplasmata archaeon]